MEYKKKTLFRRGLNYLVPSFVEICLVMSSMKRTKIHYLGNFSLIKFQVLESFIKVKLIYQPLSANYMFLLLKGVPVACNF